MRKLLLGTSALIGATALVASATAAAPELTISGSLNFQWTGGETQARGASRPSQAGVTNVGQAGEDLGASGSGWQFDQVNSMSEIKFFAEGESDGGLTYGADIQWRYLDDSIDEAYVFISGDWGTIHLGQDDGAVNQTRFYAGSVGTGAYLIDGTATYLAPKSIRSYSDANKILYVSNDLSGFKFALSVEEAQRTNEGNQFEDQYEIGASYTADLGGGSLGLSVGYQVADFEGVSTLTDPSDDTGPRTITTATGLDAVEDREEYIVGIKGGFGAFSFAASYADAGESGLTARDQSWGAEATETTTLGVGYDLGGGMAVALSYAESESSSITTRATSNARTDSVISEDTLELIAIDFSFPIMEGMSGYAGIGFSEWNRSSRTLTATGSTAVASVPADSSDATTYVIGTTVSF